MRKTAYVSGTNIYEVTINTDSNNIEADCTYGHYQKIVDYLRQMKKIKGFEKELMGLAGTLKEKYKNRLAFLDEMRRI
ncbi:MAG: hypothetical protein ACYCXK_07650 [Candidatus Humimicrobiaceae bacterium]